MCSLPKPKLQKPENFIERACKYCLDLMKNDKQKLVTTFAGLEWVKIDDLMLKFTEMQQISSEVAESEETLLLSSQFAAFFTK